MVHMSVRVVRATPTLSLLPSAMRRFSHRRTHKPNPVAAAAASAHVTGEPVPSTSKATLDDYALQPKESTKKKKRAPGTMKMPAAVAQPIVLSLGRSKQYTQRQDLPASVHPGVPAWNALFAAPGTQPSRTLRLDASTRALVEPEGWHSPGSNADDHELSAHQARRAAQHRTWRDDVLPRLAPLLLRVTHGLAPDIPVEELCMCNRSTLCNIVLADWDGMCRSNMETRALTHTFLDVRASQLRICACRPAPEQLLALGFFPCAPRRPTVAFSLRLLDFLSLHDLHVAPNVRAWASTLKIFWTRRGHVANEKVRSAVQSRVQH